MAVPLPRTRPARLPRTVAGWLADGGPVAGLNVSGLLANRPLEGQERFALAADHGRTLERVADALLQEEPALRLVLVPHVTVACAHPEADIAACRALEARLSSRHGGRVATLPNDYTATELKWIIARLSWFSGARMHATVAAFSSGVPTLGLAYSDKIAGVFEACGIEGGVADLRSDGADAVAAAALASFRSRKAMAAALSARRETMLARAAAQMDVIAKAIPGPASVGARAGLQPAEAGA
jgi:hypothetical protein